MTATANPSPVARVRRAAESIAQQAIELGERAVEGMTEGIEGLVRRAT